MNRRTHLTLSIQSPNWSSDDNPTTAVFVPVDDIGDTLVAKEDNTFFNRLRLRICYSFISIAGFFDFAV